MPQIDWIRRWPWAAAVVADPEPQTGDAGGVEIVMTLAATRPGADPDDLQRIIGSAHRTETRGKDVVVDEAILTDALATRS